MYAFRRLDGVLASAETIPFDDGSRIVLISDCHRGDGGWADDFSKNQNVYFAALTHYYKEQYTYIELGDGDELWKNSRFSDIMQTHSDVFWLLSKFYSEHRLYMLFGNHDMLKKNVRFVKNSLFDYYDERAKTRLPLFKNIKVHEGLILRHRDTCSRILLLHGHQADYFNDRLWGLGRFLVRHIWKPLEVIGVNDPTSTSKNPHKLDDVEQTLAGWVKGKNLMLIAGHTHRSVFPDTGGPPYFNDGSCVHPRCITAIELAEGEIRLVKWSVRTRADGSLYVGRDTVAGPRKISECFG